MKPPMTIPAFVRLLKRMGACKDGIDNFRALVAQMPEGTTLKQALMEARRRYVRGEMCGYQWLMQQIAPDKVPNEYVISDLIHRAAPQGQGLTQEQVDRVDRSVRVGFLNIERALTLISKRAAREEKKALKARVARKLRALVRERLQSQKGKAAKKGIRR